MNPQPVNAARNENDLQPEIIPHIVRFMLSSPSPGIFVEFQGGEPFLNFPAIVQVVDEVRRQNELAQKAISFGVVSNLMVVTDEQLSYCYSNDIHLSYTLNGPRSMHNVFRITRDGKGSHDHVVRKMSYIKKRFPGLLSSYPLCVLADDNIGQLREMVDYYHELGFRDIGTIRLKNLGNAVGNVQLDIRQFVARYLDMLDYVCEKNRTSHVGYSERLAATALRKIVGRSNPPFIDWRNPIGYVSNCIVYDSDGELLPVDEARSLRNVFSLGNVRDLTYDEFIRRRSTFLTVNLSIRDREPICRECTFNPYCGVSPVLNYSRTGDLRPVPHENDECIVILALFEWVFKKLEEDPVPLLKMLPEPLYSAAVTKLAAAGPV
jgi:radical SAM protein with 4Fe4S-binding SPASM domain